MVGGSTVEVAGGCHGDELAASLAAAAVGMAGVGATTVAGGGSRTGWGNCWPTAREAPSDTATIMNEQRTKRIAAVSARGVWPMQRELRDKLPIVVPTNW